MGEIAKKLALASLAALLICAVVDLARSDRPAPAAALAAVEAHAAR
jgi:hypothetical protein